MQASPHNQPDGSASVLVNLAIAAGLVWMTFSPLFVYWLVNRHRHHVADLREERRRRNASDAARAAASWN